MVAAGAHYRPLIAATGIFRRRDVCCPSTLPVRTPLSDLLGIEHPIIQSGMGRVAGPELVAEVCNAGAFGILAGLGLGPDELRGKFAACASLRIDPSASTSGSTNS